MQIWRPAQHLIPVCFVCLIHSDKGWVWIILFSYSEYEAICRIWVFQRERMTCRGGMDVLFGGRQKLDLDVSLKTIEELIVYLKEKELSEREELFVEGTNL